MKLLSILLLLFSIQTYGEAKTISRGVYEFFAKSARYQYVYAGSSIYTAHKSKKGFNPLSSFVVGINQRIIGIPAGDFEMRIGLHSLEHKERTNGIEISGRYSFPGFDNKGMPFYFGVGFGTTSYVEQIINNDYRSINSEIFAGARFLDVYKNLSIAGELSLKTIEVVDSLKVKDWWGREKLVKEDNKYAAVFATIGLSYKFK